MLLSASISLLNFHKSLKHLPKKNKLGANSLEITRQLLIVVKDLEE